MIRNFSVLLAAVTIGINAGAGNLPYIAPAKVNKIPYKAELGKGGAVKISLGKNSYVIDCMFSKIPGWAKFTANKADGFNKVKLSGDTFTATNASFQITRKLIMHPEGIEVSDTIKNLTKSNLPILYRNQMKLGKLKKYYVCGYRKYGRRGRGNCKINSTVIGMPQNGGSIGLLALDDIFKTHFQGYGVKGIYGIADNELVLAPGKIITLRWAAFPSNKEEYFQQINVMRRFLGVNYLVKGSFTFINPYKKNIPCFNKKYFRIRFDSPIFEIRNFLINKGVKFACSGSASGYGEQVHGSAWLKHHNLKIQSEWVEKLKKAVPGVVVSHYYHCFLDHKNAMDKSGIYDADKTLTPTGKQADYRNVNLPLFQPTLTNKWGQMQEKRLKIFIDEYKLDGIFWDEFAGSAARYHYGKPWDGVSGDIDPKTHKLKRLKSSVTLLTMPWRLKMVEMLIERGKHLIINGGGPMSETMLKFFNKNKVMAFVETGSVTTLARSHLSTPIGLGDHLTEKSELDCYRNMVEFLNYGSLYYWYYVGIRPITHKTLTSYMFPITPVELHEGYIIGKERILTNRSGWYSFGGKEDAKAHFFDKNGYEVKRELESTIKNGKKYYKIVLGEFESCALVKKK